MLDGHLDTKHFVPEITGIPIESPPQLSNSGGHLNSEIDEEFDWVKIAGGLADKIGGVLNTIFG